MRRLSVATILWFSLGLAFFQACSSPSPTEPKGLTRQSLVVTTSASGPAGTLSLTMQACSCLSGSVTVQIDGVEVGTMACGEQRQFTVTPTSYTVVISSTGTQCTFHVSQALLSTGFSVVIRCGS